MSEKKSLTRGDLVTVPVAGPTLLVLREPCLNGKVKCGWFDATQRWREELFEGELLQRIPTGDTESGLVYQMAPEAVPDKMLTNFQLVSLINRIAGKEFQSTWPAADQQLKVIASEMDELIEAVQVRDLEAMRDAVADLLVTAYGMGSVIGFDCDNDMVDVINSLLTRFDRTREDAELTQKKYRDMGIETEIHVSVIPDSNARGEWYVNKSVADQIGRDGQSYPAGKFLKSYRHQLPNLMAYVVLEQTMAATKDRPYSGPSGVAY